MTRESAIERGGLYLLDRIGAGELVSRSPDESPYKDWDSTGEAFLALDAVIAVGDRMSRAGREALVARLMRKQWRGAWDYRGGQGPDADTTASALRALDRLGRKEELEGLRPFFNPDTGLFNTFGRAADRLGLRIPPQSREKHLGAHPCVMANVWLLLLERGRLGHLDAARVAPMQRADGGWHAYYYPSPHYATRLYAELLSALGPEHDAALERTLQHLLAAPPASATRDAEMMIALSCLARRFPGRESEVRDRAAGLLEGVLAAQLADGSWPGEVIWTFLHRSSPGSVVAFDHFRVRSTSLCVRALRLWP